MEVIDGGRPLHGRPRRGGRRPRRRLARRPADRQLRAANAAVNRCSGATAASIARRSRASNVASASSTTRWRSARHCSTRAAPWADGRSDGDAPVPTVGAPLDEAGPQQHRDERADGVGGQRQRVGGGRHGDARRLDDEHQQLDGGRLDRRRFDPRPHGPPRRATQRRHRIAELATERVGLVGHVTEHICDRGTGRRGRRLAHSPPCIASGSRGARGVGPLRRAGRHADGRHGDRGHGDVGGERQQRQRRRRVRGRRRLRRAARADARSASPTLLGGRPAASIVFGANMTTLTLAFTRAVAPTLRPGDRVVGTRLDHDANVTPWRLACETAGAEHVLAPFDPATGTLDPQAVIDLIDERTAWVTLPGASNLLGTVPDLAPIIAAAHDAGARVFVDAVHLAPHRRDRRRRARLRRARHVSPYKWYGPHAGVLCADPALLDELPGRQGPPGARPRAAAVGDRHAELRGDRRRRGRRPRSCSTRGSTASPPPRPRCSPRCSTGCWRCPACACGDRRRWRAARRRSPSPSTATDPDDVADGARR